MKLILYILPTLNKNECEDIIDILDPFIKRALENNVENAKILPKRFESIIRKAHYFFQSIE